MRILVYTFFMLSICACQVKKKPVKAAKNYHKVQTVPTYNIINYLNPISLYYPKAGQFEYVQSKYETVDFKILQEQFPQLDTIAAMLQLNPRFMIEIGAHTDCMSSTTDKKQTTQISAEMIRNYLVSKGCLAKTLIPKGYGDDQPIYNCLHCNVKDTLCGEADLALNRRFEFKLLGLNPDPDLNPFDTINPKIGQFCVVEVYYNLDKSDIKFECLVNLNSVGRVLKKIHCYIFEIGSFTDCRASVAHNDSLSKERARYVKDFFMKDSLEEKSIKFQYYGERYLINNCACEPNNIGPGRDCTEREHAINRRTEIKIIGIRED